MADHEDLDQVRISDRGPLVRFTERDCAGTIGGIMRVSPSQGCPVSGFYLLNRKLSNGGPGLVAFQTTGGPIVVLFRDPERGAMVARATAGALGSDLKVLLTKIDADSLPAAVAKMIKAGLVKPGTVNVITDDDPLLHAIIAHYHGRMNDVRDSP
jgi:hypothetical protein